MKYKHVEKAVFLDRPNRFIAHVQLPGQESPETVHVKNTGRCRELLLPGSEVILSKSDNPNRKTAYDLVAVYKKGLGLINMDSQAPNAVVNEWLKDRENGLFPGITYLKPEYTYGASRMDFYLEQGNKRVLIEVKGVTLEKNGVGYFPDAPTERGTKHLRELMKAVKEGYQAYLAFVIQMPGIDTVLPHDETDPVFGQTLRQAQEEGVKLLYLNCRITPDDMVISRARIADKIQA